MGEFKEVNEDSKLLYFVADNQSQFFLCDLIWNRLGGTKLDTTEINKYIKAEQHEWTGILIGAIFLVMAPRDNIIRAFIGHGVSDKGIMKFPGFRGMVIQDYYYMSGHKDCWHFGKHNHALYHPYDKVLKTGLPRSDFFIRKDMMYDKAEIRKELGIKTNREIVLFAPTFNTGSLEFYYYDILKQLHKDYYIIFKKHDREFYFGDLTKGGTILGRKEDDTVFKVKKKVQRRFAANLLEYRGLADPVKFLAVADYYIGDSSSLDYLALYANIPMVFVKPYTTAVVDVAYEYDIRNVAPYYQRFGDLKNTLQRAKDESYMRTRKEFIDRNFFYNDGHAQDRMCEHTQNLIKLLKKRVGGWEDPHLKAQQMILKTVDGGRKFMNREEEKNEQPLDNPKDYESVQRNKEVQQA